MNENSFRFLSAMSEIEERSSAIPQSGYCVSFWLPL